MQKVKEDLATFYVSGQRFLPLNDRKSQCLATLEKILQSLPDNQLPEILNAAPHSNREVILDRNVAKHLNRQTERELIRSPDRSSRASSSYFVSWDKIDSWESLVASKSIIPYQFIINEKLKIRGKRIFFNLHISKSLSHPFLNHSLKSPSSSEGMRSFYLLRSPNQDRRAEYALISLADFQEISKKSPSSFHYVILSAVTGALVACNYDINIDRLMHLPEFNPIVAQLQFITGSYHMLSVRENFAHFVTWYVSLAPDIQTSVKALVPILFSKESYELIKQNVHFSTLFGSDF